MHKEISSDTGILSILVLEDIFYVKNFIFFSVISYKKITFLYTYALFIFKVIYFKKRKGK